MVKSAFAVEDTRLAGGIEYIGEKLGGNVL